MIRFILVCIVVIGYLILSKYIIARCKEHIDIVEQGEFGADMKVELVNDGPFTVILDSNEL